MGEILGTRTVSPEELQFRNLLARVRAAVFLIDDIVPGGSTVEQLRALRLDPRASSNITILNYSDVLRRFVPNGSTPADAIDPAVRQCIGAKTRCKGYSIALRSIRKAREGNFFADLLGFRRETRTTGWSLNGLVLIEDGAVVYKLVSGQPHIAERENRRRPPGPVMSLGGSVLRQATDLLCGCCEREIVSPGSRRPRGSRRAGFGAGRSA